MSETVNTGSQRTYFSTTSSATYSFLFSLPLLVIYELLIYWFRPSSDVIIRISADVWIKSLFSWLGYDVMSITLLLVAVGGIFVYFWDRRKDLSFSGVNFLLMLFESLLYALALFILLDLIVGNLFQLALQQADSLSVLQAFAFSLGAGLYEELFFRLFLVTALFYLAKLIFDKSWAAYLVAAVISALLFSAAHYTGSMGDLFTLPSFFYRFVAGLLLNVIFVMRGFGIAAWTHALFDLIVLLM